MVSFRGYYCRKYVHDFYARKAYMKFLTVKVNSIMKIIDNLERWDSSKYGGILSENCIGRRSIFFYIQK